MGTFIQDAVDGKIDVTLSVLSKYINMQEGSSSLAEFLGMTDEDWKFFAETYNKPLALNTIVEKYKQKQLDKSASTHRIDIKTSR